MLTTKQIIEKYGKPTENGSPYLTTIKLPFPMKLAWDKTKKVNTIRCHKLIAENLLNAFTMVSKEYTPDEIEHLGLNLYGGCFNYRKMRGGNDWSRHSWGIAIDINPESNQLNTHSPFATMSHPECKRFIDIFYQNGFINLGIERNYDWMHFEISK